MRRCGKRAIFAMLAVSCLEPVFVLKVLGLLHVGEHVGAAPSFHAPVIVVLGYSTDAERTIASTTTSYELPSSEMQLAIIELRTRLALNVPVRVSTKNLRDSGRYGRSWDTFFRLAG